MYIDAAGPMQAALHSMGKDGRLEVSSRRTRALVAEKTPSCCNRSNQTCSSYIAGTNPCEYVSRTGPGRRWVTAVDPASSWASSIHPILTALLPCFVLSPCCSEFISIVCATPPANTTRPLHQCWQLQCHHKLLYSAFCDG